VGLRLGERLIAAGYPVIAHYHSETDGVAQLRDSGAICVPGDLATRKGIFDVISAVADQAESLRAIIHNASLFEKTSTDLDSALLQFEALVNIHMFFPFALNLSLAPLLERCSHRYADIIHITDIFADKPNPAFDAYCASKAGLQSLSLSFAKRLAPKVKVNVIQPGPILFQGWHTAEDKEKVLSQTLLGVEGGVDAIALAVEAVLANPYQTGAVIAVDGGRRIA
jgi:dihydromonapterin reductase/dihydrofolate reductase